MSNHRFQHIGLKINSIMNVEDRADDFDDACSYVAALAANRQLDDRDALRFYGLYKQVTEGPCNVPKPNFFSFDFTGRKKWIAWHDLGSMPREEAAHRYVELLSKSHPSWRKEKRSSTRRGNVVGGPVFSSLAEQTEGSTAGIGEEIDFPLLVATTRGDLEKVKELLDGGMDVFDQDSDGCTVLHWAADRGHVDIIRMLVERDRRLLFVRDNDGMTCLHYACLAEKKEAAELLADLGDEELVQLRCNEGRLALDLAPASWGNLPE